MSLHDAAPALKAKNPNLARTHSPERRAQISEQMRRQWADPAYRASQLSKILATKRSPEGRARHAAKLRRFHDDPERGLKARAQALRTKIAKLQKKLAEWDRLLGNE